MRVLLISILFSLIQSGLAFGQQQQREFTLNGKFSSSYYDGLTVYLNEIDYAGTNEMLATDSTTISGDRFTFSGEIDKAINVRYITVANKDDLTALVVLESGTIDMQMSEIPVMHGTVKNDELSEFTEKQLNGRKELDNTLTRAQEMHSAGTLTDEDNVKLEAKFDSQRETMQQDVYDFVSRNILNEVGEFFFTIYASSLSVPQLERVFAASTPEFQQKRIPQELMNLYVWSLGDLREGQKLRGIDMKNQDGVIEDISVHFQKGNVVLVDFWASWCGPCIKSMPILVKLYNRYRDSGFEIVGISLDGNEPSWKSAIKRLGMEWPQYIDDAGNWRGAATAKYKITRIPQTYLLDKKGNIAGHDLSGMQLIEKIEELLTEE